MSSDMSGTADTGDTGNEGGNEGGGLDPNLFPGIENIPQQYRADVEPLLKGWNDNVNQHVSKVNSELEGWKPYQELGLRDIEPEQVAGLVQFYQMVANAEDDPSQLQAWWNNLGEQMEFFNSEEDGEVDDFGDEVESEGLTAEDVMGIVQEAISPLIDERQQEQQSQGEQQAEKIMNDEYAKIKADNPGLELDEETESAIATFAMKHPAPSGSILKGFDEYKAFVEKTQGNLFNKVESAPKPGEGPGIPNTNPPKIQGFEGNNGATAAVKRALENAAANQ